MRRRSSSPSSPQARCCASCSRSPRGSASTSRTPSRSRGSFLSPISTTRRSISGSRARWRSWRTARLRPSSAFRSSTCFAATTWLMYRIAARFFGEHAGALAALLLNISAVFSVTTGGWVLPDGPLMLFMLASVAVIVGSFVDSMPSRAVPLLRAPNTFRWAVAGVFAGLAMLSKYHGVFVLAGTFVFLLTSAPHRQMAQTPGAVFRRVHRVRACSRPSHLESRARLGFVRVSGRARGGAGGSASRHDARQHRRTGRVRAALDLDPARGRAMARGRGGPRDAARWFLACVGIGPIAAFTLIALLGDPGLPHWEAPGYLFILPDARCGGRTSARAWRRAHEAMAQRASGRSSGSCLPRDANRERLDSAHRAVAAREG